MTCVLSLHHSDMYDHAEKEGEKEWGWNKVDFIIFSEKKKLQRTSKTASRREGKKSKIKSVEEEEDDELFLLSTSAHIAVFLILLLFLSRSLPLFHGSNFKRMAHSVLRFEDVPLFQINYHCSSCQLNASLFLLLGVSIHSGTDTTRKRIRIEYIPLLLWDDFELQEMV